jgi:transposase, IS30 family
MKSKEKTSKQTYTHLIHEERKHIAYLRNMRGKSGREIALEMNRSPTSICEELRVGTVDEIYDPDLGQKKADFKRRRSKTKLLKILLDGDLRKKIEPEIRRGISPRRISGTLREEENIVISDKSIYKFVHAYNLERYLCFKGKPKTNKGQYVYRQAKELGKTRVDQRPDVRGIYGHYEMDFIVSRLSTYALLVVVEKKTHRVYIRKISNRKHEAVTRALQDIFLGKTVLSITTDNDISFSHWKQLEVLLNTKIYFCYPYHSWEKGLVENTNRWIRLYIKKKSDLALVTEETLEKIDYWFNQYPREILGFKSANALVLEATSVQLVG